MAEGLDNGAIARPWPVAGPLAGTMASNAVTAWVYARNTHGEVVELEAYESVDAAVWGVLGSWNEDEGLFLVVLTDTATGDPLGSMIRASHDPEVALVGLHDGTYARYRARYVLDDDGRYLRTEVTVL
ncbi:MAG: hypothetical protein JOZ63_08740 [Planctomycetaceae bacterium]|nr:hypothetical protein [Planctomycetaceae bacterium]